MLGGAIYDCPQFFRLSVVNHGVVFADTAGTDNRALSDAAELL